MRTTSFAIALLLVLPSPARARFGDTRLERAYATAGPNATELIAALEDVPDERRAAMSWLIERMPERDLHTLSAAFLVEDNALAFEAWKSAPWSAQIPHDVFLDAILPYASVNEARDPWRADLRARFLPLVKDAKTPGEAATILNREIWSALGVMYSTQRKRPDQSPKETMESGLASCSGLSILLIAACRSVGVPARFVGTPLWSDGSGNHSWVEVWTDGGWHFTGAAEATGEHLDRGWFKDRAATAKIGDPQTAIYASTWNDSPLVFPLVWAKNDRSVRAVEVTERYVRGVSTTPEGHGRVRFRVTSEGQRVVAPVEVVDDAGAVVFRGDSKDERFDTNDHLTAILPLGKRLRVRVSGVESGEFEVTADELLVPLAVPPAPRGAPANSGRSILARLDAHLAEFGIHGLATADFAEVALDANEASAARERLWTRHVAEVREGRKAEFDARAITVDGVTMKFWYRTFGEKPKNGRSLWISMHGGGGAPAEINDKQWQNQKRLYELEEGVYVAPRAPTDTWNLWHQGHIDSLFARLIADMVVFEEVDPDRVYILGYSAGGDGVYQLAPRMADRLAAAGMMAGHPNDANPFGLRNIGFALHMGANDAAYDRNAVAAKWGEELDRLEAEDPGGYPHQVVLHEGKGHWMDREDRMALPWMAKFTRDPYPTTIKWLQGAAQHRRFYWLALDEPAGGARIVASRNGQQIRILEAEQVAAIRVRLDDAFIDLSKEVTIERNGAVVFQGKVDRTIANLAKTLSERGDPRGMFAAEMVIPAQ